MSVKLSTISDDALSLEVAKDLLLSMRKDIARAALMETYYTRKMVMGDKSAEMMLGRTQAQLKEWRGVTTFLIGHIDTLESA